MKYISRIGESWWQDEVISCDMLYAENTGYIRRIRKEFICPFCSHILDLNKDDFIVDKDIDAVYCANCSAFLGYIWDFQPLGD